MAKATRSSVSEFKVPFRDIDMNGSMFLSSYISYAEAALASFWSARPSVEAEPVYSVSRVMLNLKKPLAHQQPVSFTAAVDKIGLQSAGFMITAESGGEKLAEIEITWQARDPGDGSFMPLPEETRDWLYGFLV